MCKIHGSNAQVNTSTLHNQPEEEALQPRPISESHPDKMGLHVATQELRKMWEPKFSKLKGGYTSSAGLFFLFWLKDMCVHIQDRRLTQREAIQLVKDFTVECSWDEVEFYMDMVTEEDQSLKGLVEHLQNTFQSSKTLRELSIFMASLKGAGD